LGFRWLMGLVQVVAGGTVAEFQFLGLAWLQSSRSSEEMSSPGGWAGRWVATVPSLGTQGLFKEW
jgi:hypothetical protein